MGKITFILGGARSGKSSYALKIAKDRPGKVAFIATCEAKDKEMKGRIAIHRTTRPSHWTTFEEPRNIDKRAGKISPSFKTVIIDCLTLWITNLMMENMTPASIEKKARQLVSIMKKMKADSIVVSNEVGLGIVPDNKLARDFRDIAGRVNQIIAGRSDKVYFMISGIPMKLTKNK